MTNTVSAPSLPPIQLPSFIGFSAPVAPSDATTLAPVVPVGPTPQSGIDAQSALVTSTTRTAIGDAALAASMPTAPVAPNAQPASPWPTTTAAPANLATSFQPAASAVAAAYAGDQPPSFGVRVPGLAPRSSSQQSGQEALQRVRGLISTQERRIEEVQRSLEQPTAAGAPGNPALQARLEHARRATSQLQQLVDRLSPVADRMTPRHAQMLVTVGDDVRTRGVFSHVTADMLVRDVFGIR